MIELQTWLPTVFMTGMGEILLGTFMFLFTKEIKTLMWRSLQWKPLSNHRTATKRGMQCGQSFTFQNGFGWLAWNPSMASIFLGVIGCTRIWIQSSICFEISGASTSITTILGHLQTQSWQYHSIYMAMKAEARSKGRLRWCPFNHVSAGWVGSTTIWKSHSWGN